MKKQALENWKDEVMNSLEGLQRAEPGPELLSQIKARLQPEAKIIRWSTLAAAAAGILLLLMANFFAIRQTADTRSSTTQSSSYSVYTSLNLYDE